MLYFIAPYNIDTNTDHSRRMALLRFLERHHIAYDIHRLKKFCGGEGYFGVLVVDLPKPLEERIISEKFLVIKTDQYPLKKAESALTYIDHNDEIYEFKECR